MNSHIRRLVATIVDLIMLSSLILSFFSLLIALSNVLLLFVSLCHCMLLHYLKLEPSWLRHEVAWVAYSTLISHICTLVATIVDLITLSDIVLSCFFFNRVPQRAFIIFFVPTLIASST